MHILVNYLTGQSFFVSVGRKSPLMRSKWKIEFYEDAQGRRPVEKWIDGLNDQKAQAVLVALQEVLAVNGVTLASGAWLKSLGKGLYEF